MTADILTRLSPNMVGYWDYRSRSGRDWAGVGVNAAYNGTSYYTGAGIKNTKDVLVAQVPYDSSQQITTGTIICGLKPVGPDDIERFFGNDLTGYYFLYFGPGKFLQFYTNVTNAVLPHTADSSESTYAVSFDSGSAPMFYKNGGFLGNGSVALTGGVTASPLFLSEGVKKNFNFAMLVNRVLTPAEHQEISEYLSVPKWPTAVLRRWKDVSGKAHFKTEWGINESVNSRFNTRLENSPLTIFNGTWRVDTEVLNGKVTKVIRNLSDGTAIMPIGEMGQGESDAAYGMWEYHCYKEAGDYHIVGFSNSGSSIEAPNSWYVKWDNADDRFKLANFGAGFIIVSDVKPVNAWYKVTVVRDPSNNWVLFIDDVLVGTANSALTTTVRYFGINCSAGTKTAYSSLDGTQSIVKMVI